MEITKLINTSNLEESFHKEQFASDVLMGLCSKPKTISAKYFYDDVGSELFQKITQHEDYYPTRTEYKILNSLSKKLPNLIEEKEIDIIELGVGDGHKSKLIIDGFIESGCKVNFYPIDISEKALELLKENIEESDVLKVHGIVAEYFDGLRFARKKSTNRQLVLFLGSNIGNFNKAQSQAFLRGLWNGLNHDDYSLIGFDLKKDISRLTAAYNDSAGYTKAFNLNLLTRINRELGANFQIDKFQHFGSYNPALGAMESYLLATENQEVYVADLQRSFYFEAFEPLHLEYSFKYLRSDIESMGTLTGFDILEHFSDTENLFVNSLWKVKKSAQH